MLTLYRRHLTTGFGSNQTDPCPHCSDRFYRRCSCPIWVIGADPRGKYHRRSLRTVNWSVAEEQRRKLETGDEDRPRIEIGAALDAWLAALRSAKRKERTVKQVHGAAAESLRTWCKAHGDVHLDRLTLAVLDEFVTSWKYATSTHRQRINLLRQFFKFCVARKWIRENPAAGLLKPAEDQEPTLPFTVEEEARIFAAAARFDSRPNFGGLWATHHLTARALLLVMRYTGLRACDAVLFDPRSIHTMTVDSVAVPVYATYQTKTREWVMCPIPPTIAADIQGAPRLTAEHAFIPPESSGLQRDARSVTNNFYATYLTPLSTLASVTELRAHRFRDTFAVRLLEEGKPLEIVQMLLGHKSIKTTEKHYAPWVRSRQEMLIREVMATWHKD